MAKISTFQPGPADDDDEDHPLDLQGLSSALLRRWWLVALAAIVAGLAVWALTRRLPEMYESVAVIQIETQEQKAINLRNDVLEAMQDNLQNPEVVETIIERFHSRVLMEHVSKALGLASDRRFLGFTPAQPVSDDRVVSMLLSGSQAALRPHTRLIDVTFTHRDRDVAYRVANALVDQFLTGSNEQRTEMLGTQNRVLVEKSRELKEKVDRSEQALQEYKQKTVASVSLDDSRNLVEEKLKGLNTDFINAKAERLRIESDADQAKRTRASTQQLLAISSIAQDPQVLAAQERLTKEQADLTTLSQRYGPLHPRMTEARANLEAAQQGVVDAVRTAPDRIDSRFTAAKAREAGLQRAVQEQEAALLELDGKVIPFHALQREYESDRALFEAVLQRLKESNLQLGVQSVDFDVIEPASAAHPAPNRRPLFILAGTVAGAGLAGGLLAVVFLLGRTISSVEAAERLLKLPVLAAVPRMSSLRTAGDVIAVMNRPASPEAESFRSLRTSLEFLLGKGPQTIVITSAIPGEGKSVSAGNIAVAFAQLGRRTLLIEADLRRPSLDALFQPAKGEAKGLGGYLKGGPLNIVPTEQEHLSFLPAGTLLDDPAEALAGSRFGRLLEEVKGSYDRIVIDTAPVNVVSETLNIVAGAAAVCLVVRSHSTSQKLVQRAVELLKRAGVRPDGVILNWVVQPTSRKYHDYYKGGTGYGSKENYSKPRAATPASSVAKA